MKIQIGVRGLEVTEALRAHVERKLGFSLARFRVRIARVNVRFWEDDTQHQGGAGKRCEINVGLRPSGSMRAEDRNTDLFTAFDHAADRVSRSIARTLKRDEGSIPR